MFTQHSFKKKKRARCRQSKQSIFIAAIYTNRIIQSPCHRQTPPNKTQRVSNRRQESVLQTTNLLFHLLLLLLFRFTATSTSAAAGTTRNRSSTSATRGNLGKLRSPPDQNTHCQSDSQKTALKNPPQSTVTMGKLVRGDRRKDRVNRHR